MTFLWDDSRRKYENGILYCEVSTRNALNLVTVISCTFLTNARNGFIIWPATSISSLQSSWHSTARSGFDHHRTNISIAESHVVGFQTKITFFENARQLKKQWNNEKRLKKQLHVYTCWHFVVLTSLQLAWSGLIEKREWFDSHEDQLEFDKVRSHTLKILGIPESRFCPNLFKS